MPADRVSEILNIRYRRVEPVMQWRELCAAVQRIFIYKYSTGSRTQAMQAIAGTVSCCCCSSYLFMISVSMAYALRSVCALYGRAGPGRFPSTNASVHEVRAEHVQVQLLWNVYVGSAVHIIRIRHLWCVTRADAKCNSGRDFGLRKESACSS